MRSGIYKIYSLSVPGRVYIGSAISLSRRKTEHFRRLKAGTHPNVILLRHFRKYGESDLVFEIIEHCSEYDLIAKEQNHIDSNNPYFNICKHAGNTIGRHQSHETRLRRSAKLKGRKRTIEERTVLSQRALERYTIPDRINGMTVIDKQCKISPGRRYIKLLCPYCSKEFVKTRREAFRMMHCGCVKPSRLKITKSRKNRINGIKPRSDSTSQYVGVTFDKAVMKWRARIKVHGKLIALGNFSDPLDACKARRQYIIDHNLTDRYIGSSLT